MGASLIVGRASDSGLVLNDTAASRRHVEIRATGGGYLCRDLGSRNGTIVNGSPTNICELNNGDRVLIGETVLRFEMGAESTDATVQGKTIFLQTILDPSGREQEPLPTSGSQALLEAAYTLMNALASNFNPCDLVDRVLETTTTAIRAHRGAILFAGPDGRLEPCGICGNVHTIRHGKSQPAKVAEINISESVANRVLRDGENVLYKSGWANGSVDPSASIAALNLTSILCVPIRTQDSILGILYMDTDVADHEYTNDDLLLAAAAGNSAGLALENARNHKLLLEKQRMEQDIEAAWTIQAGFLVSDWPTDDSRFEVYGTMVPAKVVGGDFYDFARIDENRLGLLIGDVSGKGVPAALTMAQLLAEFRLRAQGVKSPADLLATLNEGLVQRSQRGMFCTVAVVAIDLRDGRLLGANAGHHPMLIASEERIVNVLEASGPPIGVLPGISWVDETGTIEPGETLVFYTDGIVEARSGATRVPGTVPQAEYGLQRVERVVREQYPTSPRQLVDSIVGEVQDYCAPMSPHDDCTMIALRYNGNES
ncbi:MAG: SpoIIE family protein phosphatase [Acidobacteria bacterium]|nr:SpoIIE family protein phosphatase [Candidatus Sulfomarinibacter kjeldsenii]